MHSSMLRKRRDEHVVETKMEVKKVGKKMVEG